MSVADTSRRTRAQALGLAMLAFLISLAMTGLVLHFHGRAVHEREHAHFQEITADINEAIQKRIDTYIDAMLGISALYRASLSVERDEFSTYVDSTRLLERYPGIMDLGFIRRVPGIDLEDYLTRTRNDRSLSPAGYPDFTITPADPRAEYFPVEYVKPENTGGIIMGQDMYMEPVRHEAMQQAVETGMPSATGKIHLLGDTPSNDRVGAIIILPLFMNHMPIDTPAQRHANLSGFLFSRFSVNDLISNIFGGKYREQVSVRLFDDPAMRDEDLLYADGDDPAPVSAGDSHTHSAIIGKLDVANRRWYLQVTPHPVLINRSTDENSYYLLLGGMVLSLLLAALAWILARNSARQVIQNQALQFQATHDSLTGLPNRSMLYQATTGCLGRLRPGGVVALLLIDLNGFKEINDTLGHHSGDDLLRQIGPRMRSLLGEKDMFARLGGDEFAVMLCSRDGREGAVDFARRVLEALSNPFDISGLKLKVGASIGIAYAPAHGNDVTTLMRCADVAMYLAKDIAEGYAVYNPDQDQHSTRRLALMTELDEAIRNDQLVLHYQPIVSLRHRNVIGVEALVRWEHPRHGLIPPDQFIPQAEKSELIKPLTFWVLDHAMAQCRAWLDEGLDITMSVNISARNLQDIDLPDKIGALLAEHRLDPERLDLEITESAIILDPDRSKETLARLFHLGLPITIDDFGTGYTSLAALKTMPLRCLKIDRSFVADMVRDDNDAVIVRSLIDLSHNLGLTVVGEGVEETEVLDILEILRCDAVQGYLICRPQPAAQIRDYLWESQEQTPQPFTHRVVVM